MSISPKRALGQLDVVCLGVNSIVGSGIFLYPAELGRLLGSASPLAFVLAAGTAVLIGLCMAELAARFDRTGGPMVYAAEGFGPAVGFTVGWLNFLALITAWAAVARGVGSYLARYLEVLGTASGEAALAMAIVATFTAINYLGIRPAAWVTDAFTLGKLVPLLLLAAVGLYAADTTRIGWAPAAPADWGRAWFVCMFAMGGFENVGVPAGETRDPRRSVPIGIVSSVLGAALVYVAVQTAAVGVLPGLGSSRAPLADAAAAVLGPTGAVLLTVGAAVSMIGFTSGNAMLTPRALLALSEVGDMPRGLSQLHDRFATPHRAILVVGGVAMLLAAFLDFGALADFGLVATLLAYSLSCAALLRVRRRKDVSIPRFQVPFAPLVVTAAVAICLVLATRAGVGDVLLAAGLLAFGFLVRFLVR